jgi:hypothetical protein
MDAGPRPDGEVRPPDAPREDGAPPPDDGGGGGGDAGGGGRDAGMPIDFCRLSCSAPSDCTTASAAFDADNYTCEGSVCVYQGCNTDAECQSSFASDRYVCRDPEATGTSLCVLRCTTVADCSTGSAAFDADNYDCVASACVYQGCNDDSECRSSFADARYGCREVIPPDTGVPLPMARRNCVLTCTAASDCTTASPAFDADNYACVDTACVYRGCNDAAECRASFSDARYTCG